MGPFLLFKRPQKMNQEKRSNKENQRANGVGTMGKVGVLMMQELNLPENSKPKPKPASSKRRPSPSLVSVCCGASTNKQTPTRSTSSDKGTKSLCSRNASNRRRGESPKKRVHQTRSSQKIPMLKSEDFWMDKTPARGKAERRRGGGVEVVDFNCGSLKKAWSASADGRLSFSKLAN